MKILQFFLLLVFIPVIGGDPERPPELLKQRSLGSSPSGTEVSTTPDEADESRARAKVDEQFAAACAKLTTITSMRSTRTRYNSFTEEDEEGPLMLELTMATGDTQVVSAEPLVSLAEAYGAAIPQKTYDKMSPGRRRFYVPADQVQQDNTDKTWLRREKGDYVLAVAGCSSRGRILCQEDLRKSLVSTQRPHLGTTFYGCKVPIAFTFVPYEGRYRDTYGKTSPTPVPPLANTHERRNKGFDVVKVQAKWVIAPPDPQRGKSERLKLSVMVPSGDGAVPPVERQVSADQDVSMGGVGGMQGERLLTIQEAVREAARRERLMHTAASPPPGHPLYVFEPNPSQGVQHLVRNRRPSTDDNRDVAQ